MKKNIYLIYLIITLFSFSSNAQYSTPGNYGSYTLDDLVAISGGVVVFNDNSFWFTEDVTISQTDTLYIADDGILSIYEDVLWTIKGVLLMTPPDEFLVNKTSEGGYFRGIRFEDSPVSRLYNMVSIGGGGIKLVNSDMEFHNCSITYYDQGYCSAAIDLFQSDPLIYDCFFEYNDGAAIASAANGASSPRIIKNHIWYNDDSNQNVPQINLGTSNGTDPIVIDSNSISSFQEMSGGITVSTLAGGNLLAFIRGNIIERNRYGIAVIGDNIHSVISGNIILDNFNQGEPMQGGSGINFYGGESNTSMVSHNIIKGNLWGITIVLNAKPNMGDGSSESPGYNRILHNINSFQDYNLYNNTSGEIMALNNFWGTEDVAEAEETIYHVVDDPSLGEVFFDPMWTNPLGIEKQTEEMLFTVYPNPCSHYFRIELQDGESAYYEVFDVLGHRIADGFLDVGTKDIYTQSWEKAVYYLRIKTSDRVFNKTLIVEQ